MPCPRKLRLPRALTMWMDILGGPLLDKQRAHLRRTTRRVHRSWDNCDVLGQKAKRRELATQCLRNKDDCIRSWQEERKRRRGLVERGVERVRRRRTKNLCKYANEHAITCTMGVDN